MKSEEIKEITQFLENKGFENVEVAWNTPRGSLMLELTVEGSRKNVDPEKPIEKEPCDTVKTFPFAPFGHMCWGIDFGYPELQLTDENLEKIEKDIKQSYTEYTKDLIDGWMIGFWSNINNSEMIKELNSYKWNDEPKTHTDKQVCELLDEFKKNMSKIDPINASWYSEQLHQLKIDKGLIKEQETKLELGFVYRDKNLPSYLMNYNTDGTVYGFNLNGNWHYWKDTPEQTLNILNNGTPNELATQEEWIEALTKEAENQGIVTGATIQTLLGTTVKLDDITEMVQPALLTEGFYLYGYLVMANGKWAKTVQEEPKKPCDTVEKLTSAKNLYNMYHIETRQLETFKVLKASFKLSKEQMLDALKNETINCEGIEYKTPESKLLGCLKNRKFGLVELELIQVEKE